MTKTKDRLRRQSTMKKTTKKIIVAVAVTTTLATTLLPTEEIAIEGKVGALTPAEQEYYAEVAEDIKESKEYELTTATELYNVPLDEGIQEYLISEAHIRGLDPRLVLAVCSVESDFDMNCISENDYGIMQINKCNHARLEEKLELMDIMDVYDNISAGCEMLYEIKQKYPEEHLMLMVYNMGETGAKRCWRDGKYSSRYSRKVMERMANIERV